MLNVNFSRMRMGVEWVCVEIGIAYAIEAPLTGIGALSMWPSLTYHGLYDRVVLSLLGRENPAH